MTRTVRDAALMLDVLAGPDDRDRHSLPSEGRSYLEACEESIAGWSVAWSPDLGVAQVEPEVARITEEAAAVFEALGCRVETVATGWEDSEEIFTVMAAAEMYAAWRERLPDWRGRMDPTLVRYLERGGGVTIGEYLQAARRRREFWTQAQGFLARFDLLLTPTVAVPPFAGGGFWPREIAGQKVSPLGWMAFTYPFNLTGQPAASIPAGFTADGLPVGLQIVGRRHADGAVLAASAAFEAARPWASRKPSVD
jgi:aspartyl-tRNA(Asn)/glutamyl-tRNA(Gln) amidotransferase subunit A